MGAGGDGDQVRARPLLPVDRRDELVENVSVGVVLAEIDDVYVDLNYIAVLTKKDPMKYNSHLLFL